MPDTPIPVLFTYGSQYGNKVLFGLLTNEGLHPVRVVASDKVRSINGSKQQPVPDTLDILIAGQKCLEFLAETDLLEGLLMAMASDMHRAVCSRIKIARTGRVTFTH